MSGPKTSYVRVNNQQLAELTRQQQAELEERLIVYRQMEMERMIQEGILRKENMDRIRTQLSELNDMIKEIENCSGESWYSGGEIEVSRPVMHEAERIMSQIENGHIRKTSDQLKADNNILKGQISNLERVSKRIREMLTVYGRIRQQAQATLRNKLELQTNTIRRRIGEMEAIKAQAGTEISEAEEYSHLIQKAEFLLSQATQSSGSQISTSSEMERMLQISDQLDKLSEKISEIQMNSALQAVRLNAERLDVGFSLSFAATVVETKPRKPKKEAFNATLFDRVMEELNGLYNLNLSGELLSELKSLLEEAGRIRDNFYLENFYQVVVIPFIKQCSGYDEIRKEYDRLLAKCEIFAEACNVMVQPPEVTRAGIEELKEQFRKLEQADLARRQKSYIDQAVDEVMREMGYELVGDREVVKKNGRVTRHELYSLNEGTAVDVTYGANGQISMELGGLDTEDREPTRGEASQLVEDMRQFCTHYETIARRLARRGVEMEQMQLLPPDAQYAQIININDYRLKGRNITGYSAGKQRKAGQQMHQRKEN